MLTSRHKLESNEYTGMDKTGTCIYFRQQVKFPLETQYISMHNRLFIKDWYFNDWSLEKD